METLIIVVLALEGVLLMGVIAIITLRAVRGDRYNKKTLPNLLEIERTLATGVGNPLAHSGLREMLEGLSVTFQIRIFADLAPKLGDYDRRQLAALAQEIGLVDHALALSRSKVGWRRLYSARLLTILNAEEEVMIPFLHDSNHLVRAQAAEWAAAHPNPTIINQLLNTAIYDDSALCRFTAQDSLERMGGVSADFMLGDSNLGTLPEPAALSGPTAIPEHLPYPALEGSLPELKVSDLSPALAPDQSRPLDRNTAQEVISETREELAARLIDARSLPLALKLSQDRSPSVRLRAVTRLGEFGGEEAVESLTQSLGDDTAAVRTAAVQALGSLGHWPAAGDVAHLLDDSNPTVRREAGLALNRLGAPGKLLLRRALSSDNSLVRDTAREVLDFVPVGRASRGSRISS